MYSVELWQSNEYYKNNKLHMPFATKYVHIIYKQGFQNKFYNICIGNVGNFFTQTKFMCTGIIYPQKEYLTCKYLQEQLFQDSTYCTV
jgi:hypothetical protein